jgi:hypothetical protein
MQMAILYIAMLGEFSQRRYVRAQEDTHNRRNMILDI